MMSRTIFIQVLAVIVIFVNSLNVAHSEILKPLYDLPYLVVYGRDTCPYTSKMRKELNSAGIKYHYKVIDEPKVKQLIHKRMQLSGFSTKEFTLPVVDVNNEILVHPIPTEVLDLYSFGVTE